MPSKKMMIILAVAAALCFGGGLAASYMFKKKSPDLAHGKATTAPTTAPSSAAEKLALTGSQSQLEDLIKEVRLKVQDCKRRELQLNEREKRVAMSEELLKKETQQLENLRIGLVAPLTNLKQEMAKLDKSRIKVTQDEIDNIKHTAIIYEKMDPASGAKIIESMCNGPLVEDAARILYFMSERSAAKLLGELTDKAMASNLCDRMKRIRQEG
jgi:flagellar motility protein MotE (MotC chaperone)